MLHCVDASLEAEAASMACGALSLLHPMPCAQGTSKVYDM